MNRKSLRAFCRQVLESLDVQAEEARITADVLLYADVSGIDSHGVALLGTYARNLRNGAYAVRRTISVAHETPSTTLIDGGGGLGHAAAFAP